MLVDIKILANMKKWHKSFVEALLNNDLKSAQEIRDVNLPKKLYQYCSFSIRTLANLDKNRIWLSNPTNFNDPYDTALNLLYKTEQTAIKHWESLSEKIGIQDFISRDDFVKIYLLPRFQFYPELAKRLSKKGIGRHYVTIKSFIELSKTLSDNDSQSASAVAQNSFFVGCMTENYKSILMWSHYANHHRGLCLEYDVSNSFPDIMRRNLYPVIYSDKLFDGSHLFTINGVNNSEMLAASLHKSHEWSYEREWRIALSNPSELNGQFMDDVSPSEILIGAKMSRDDIDLVTGIATSKRIGMSLMYMDHNKFGLSRIRIA